MKSKILINSGSTRFFLIQTAEELSRRNMLGGLVCGVILSHNSRIRILAKRIKWVSRFANRSKYLQRRDYSVAILGEIFWQMAVQLQNRTKFVKLKDLFFWLSSWAFSRKAIRKMKKIKGDDSIIYHVRSGFGGNSIKFARQKNYKVIVDHSIAHPHFIASLSLSGLFVSVRTLSLDRVIMQDISNADLLLVNSEFVKSTFQIENYSNCIVVALPPIDTEVTEKFQQTAATRTGIVFIGKCEMRKGIDTLYEIVCQLDKRIRVQIMGNWEINSLVFKEKLSKFPNVEILPYSDSTRVAELLLNAKIFLFPTRAEGAARVVGEAMHAGCAIFTTIESGIHIEESFGRYINNMSIPEIITDLNYFLNQVENFEAISQFAKRSIAMQESEYFSILTSSYQKFDSE